MLHYYPRHVSSINMPIFRRKNCIHTASGIVTLCKRLHSTPVESRLCSQPVYCDVHKETKKKSWTRNGHFGMLNTQITYPHKHPNVYSCDTLMELISDFRSSANNLESNSVQTKRSEQIPYYSVSRKNKSGCSVGVTGTMGEECRHLERAVCGVF
jgi:hypothetical protein